MSEHQKRLCEEEKRVCEDPFPKKGVYEDPRPLLRAGFLAQALRFYKFNFAGFKSR